MLGRPPAAGRGSDTFPAPVRPPSVVGGGWKLGLEAPSLCGPRLGTRQSPLPCLTWQRYPLAPRTTGLASETDTPGGTDTGNWAPSLYYLLQGFKFGNGFFSFDEIFGEERSMSGRHFLADRDEISDGFF